MPANLPPEAKAKFVKYMEAKTPEEKLEALKEFIASVPKHKGTENLLYWARRRMAELREEIEERKRKRVGGGGPTFFIEKEGAAQVVLIGLPNSGKSSVLRRLTNARVTVSDVPYSTRLPVPGMMRYEDIQFQLVEAPSLIPGGGGWNSRVVGMAKNADAVALVIDASAGPLGQLRTVLRILRDGGVELRKPRGYVTIERLRGGAGIRVVANGRLIGCTLDDIRRLLEGYRVYSALVKVFGEVTLDDVEEALYASRVYKPSVVLLNKIDLLDTSRVNRMVREVAEEMGSGVPVLPVSALRGDGLDRLGGTLFRLLDLVRVYTKPPNGKPSDKPLVVRRGATVIEVAKAIHSRLYREFAYARIWGPSARYPGQKVGADHVVEDGDVVEIHTRR